MYKRFLLITALILFAALRAEAQQAKQTRIAVIGAAEEPRFSEVMAGLKKGLAKLRYTLEVQEIKVPRADEKKVKSIVEGLLRQETKVLFLIGSWLLKPVREASGDIPVVFITPGDPVAAGLVDSDNRPGRNTTAMTFDFPELSGKRLDLLKEIAPKVRRVLTVYDPDPRDGSPRQIMMEAHKVAPKLGLTLIEREARGSEELRRGLEAIEDADAYLSIPGGFPTGYYQAIIHLLNKKRRPGMFHADTASTTDALASYGASDGSIAQEAAGVVNEILSGKNAGDIPVRHPKKLDFVINLKTAKEIGLTIPPNVLARADKVIR